MQNDKIVALNTIKNETYNWVIREDINPKVLELVSFFKEKIGYDKEVWIGDADCYIGIEKYHKYDILTIRNVVTCFDLNNILFKVGDNPHSDKEADDVLMCQLANDIEKLAYEDRRWGDQRDFKDVSLQTHRDNGFKFGYKDNRDKFHVYRPSILEKGKFNNWSRWDYGCGFIEDNVEWVLQEVEWVYQSIVVEEEYSDE